LGHLRYSICVRPEDEQRAAAIAREHNFPGPIVGDAATDDASIGPLRFRAPFPRWLTTWARQVDFNDDEYPAADRLVVTRAGLRRDSFGMWVSRADTHVLGAGGLRAQLAAVRERRSETLIAVEATAERANTIAGELDSIESRLVTQERRRTMVTAVSDLPQCEHQLRQA